MIQRVKKFNIGEKSFTVSFPNVGQIIDVEFVSVYQNEIKPWYDGVMKSLKEAVINSEKDAADGNSEG